MRYIVYESNEKLVPLQKEVMYINDYLKIFNLRVAESDDVCINFKLMARLKINLLRPCF